MPEAVLQPAPVRAKTRWWVAIQRSSRWSRASCEAIAFDRTAGARRVPSQRGVYVRLSIASEPSCRSPGRHWQSGAIGVDPAEEIGLRCEPSATLLPEAGGSLVVELL